MRIRPAVASDMTAIVTCEELAFSMSHKRGNIRDISQRTVLAAQIDEGQIHVLIEDDRILGYITYSPGSDYMFVDTLAVLPKQHRKGLGTRLLSHAERAASRLGLGSVKLFTDGNISGNVLFYQRRGYLETDRCVDEAFSRIFYSKAIA